MTLREMIGQKLVVGFPGTELDGEFIRLVEEYKVGNIILFRHNIESEEQLAALCAELRRRIRAATGAEPFITIDQEGGVVTRLPDDTTNPPGAMAVAAAGGEENAYEMGYLTGCRLRALGVDFDLAPVMDVNSNPDNPVIGVRSYGDDPAAVARYATAMMKGLTEGGVYASLKHFPGHGDTAVDSHIGLPCIDKSLEELEQRELIPFRAGIAAGAPAVMSTHILFPQLEPGGVPATMSRAIMTDLLRGRLGFEGLVISDCMEMQAIATHYGTVNGVLAAMNAGVDLVFVSHTAALAREAVVKAEEALAEGRMDRGQLEESARRILEHKARCAALGPVHGTPGAAQCRAAVNELRQKSVTAVQLPQGGLPALGETPLFLGCPDYRSTLASSAASGDFTFAEEMCRLAGAGQALVTPKDPTDAEIEAITAKAAGHSCLVLGTYNGHILKGQLALARALAATGLPMILVALRNPYDLAELPPHVAGLAAWEYTPAMFRALWPVLCGETPPQGRLPLARLR